MSPIDLKEMAMTPNLFSDSKPQHCYLLCLVFVILCGDNYIATTDKSRAREGGHI